MINFYDSLGVSGGLNISANTTTNAIYVSQLGVGNAMLIEDSVNPDATPFIINSGGSVNIGRIEYLETSSGTKPKLQVNNSTSQIPFSGLPFTTNFIVQGFTNNNIGFFTTDNNTSQVYFGTPSSVYGAKLSWYYTGSTFDLSTQTTGGTLTFGTDQGIERMKIQSDGNVGIGTSNPSETLDVSGKTKTVNLQITSGATDGYILKSDTNGNASWVDPNTTLPPTLNYGLFAQTGNSTPITNTVVETTLLDGGVGTLTVPANGFQVGDSFKIELAGHISCNSAATLRIRIKSGAVILGDTGVVAMDTATNKHWNVKALFTIRALGAAGAASIATGGVFSYSKTSGNNFEGFDFSTVNNTTFDTTTSNTLDVTAEWGAANVVDTIYSEVFVLNKIY